MNDDGPESLIKIMTNLAYLWIVHHGETFSLISVSSNFYLVPPMMRRPLSDTSSIKRELTNLEKQEFLPHPDIIKDSMTLHKVVTFRTDDGCIISRWNDFNIENDIWLEFMKTEYPITDKLTKRHYLDFWNDITLFHE